MLPAHILRLLQENDIDVDCESPLELSMDLEGETFIATGPFAEMIINYLQQE